MVLQSQSCQGVGHVVVYMKTNPRNTIPLLILSGYALILLAVLAQGRKLATLKRAAIAYFAFYALGAILFEMLTGRQTFAGDTVSDLLASVLKVEPNLETLPEATPPA